jgi:hypothetical protein
MGIGLDLPLELATNEVTALLVFPHLPWGHAPRFSGIGKGTCRTH